MSGKAIAAAVLGVGGLVLALWFLSREVGPFAAEPVALADASAVTLDTVAVRGRRIEASINGIVVEVRTDGDVRLAVPGGTVELRMPETAEVAVEDRLLAAGRLRSRGGRRYVEVDAWSVVEATVRPPAAGGL